MAELPVHKSFGEFYRFASLSPNSDLLNNRWKVVQATLAAAGLSELLDLVRFMFDLTPATDSSTDALRAKCLAADPSFPAHGAELELKAIAGIVLLQTIDSGGDYADAVTLAILAGECKAHRAIAPFAALVSQAALSRAARAVAIRRRSPLTISSLTGAKKALEALKTVQADPTAVRDAAAQAVHEANQNVLKVYEILKEVVENTADDLAVLSEESNILWWVLGERSSELGQPLASMAAATAALSAARELAALTWCAPGPQGAPFFLSRQLSLVRQASSPLSLSDAVAAMPLAWRMSFRKEIVPLHLDLCPVAQALLKSTEVDDASGWHAPYQKATKLSATAQFDPLKLGEQLFDELMFLSSLPEK